MIHSNFIVVFSADSELEKKFSGSIYIISNYELLWVFDLNLIYLHIFAFRNALDNLKNTLLEIGEPRQLVVPCVQCGDNKIIMARQVTKEEVERNPAFAEFLQVSRSNSPNDRRASRVSSRSRSSVCRHRGTPGHKCGQRYVYF